MDIPTYTTTIEECGDDYFISLPQQIIDGLGLKDGDLLEVEVHTGAEVVIVIKKVVN